MNLLTDILFELYELPNWQLAGCFIGFFLFFGLSGLLIFRRFIYSNMRLSSETNEGVNFFAQTVGVLYGLLMGLVAVSCWDSFDKLDDLISDEVSSIGSFYRMSYGLESEYRPEIQKKTLEYLEEILTVDWPRYAEGVKDFDTSEHFLELRAMLFTINPSSPNQQIIYQIVLKELEHMVHSRRLRINAFLDAGVPQVFWSVLFAGALLSIVMTYFVHFPSHLAHASLISIYTIALGFMFFLIAALDNPYRGEVHVSTEPYEALQKSLLEMREKETTLMPTRHRTH
jgi:Protein of unknown function (DUF4239)